MSSCKLSVVVPIYNVSEYLPKCLNSLTNQSLKDIEIILVNDASPDPEDDSICVFFSKKDDRIKYITHQENRGLGGARNTGIQAASSDYIGFVDSDDWVELDMFEKLYEAIRKKDADISQCYFMEHKGGLSNVRKLKRFRKKRDILNATNVLFWNKVFRKELFTKNNIFFPEKHSLEDLATMPRLLYHVKSMAQVKEPLYHYIVTRPGALTANYDRIFSDHSVVFNIIKRFMKEEQVWDRDRLYFEKRVLKSLTHDVKRFAQDDLFTEQEKNKVLNRHLHKSLTFLEKPEEIDIESIDLTEQSLRNYKWKLEAKSLLKVI